MIIKLLLDLIIGALSVVLTPFSFVDNLVYNIFEDTKFIALLKVVTFFFSRTTLIALIGTLIFWLSIFTIRPLVNFIRNRS